MLLNHVAQRRSKKRAFLNTKLCFTSTSRLGKTSSRLSASRKVSFHTGNQLKRLESVLRGGMVKLLGEALMVALVMLFTFVDTLSY